MAGQGITGRMEPGALRVAKGSCDYIIQCVTILSLEEGHISVGPDAVGVLLPVRPGSGASDEGK